MDILNEYLIKDLSKIVMSYIKECYFFDCKNIVDKNRDNFCYDCAYKKEIQYLKYHKKYKNEKYKNNKFIRKMGQQITYEDKWRRIEFVRKLLNEIKIDYNIK